MSWYVERMFMKKGIPVSPGVAIAKALVLDAQDQPVQRKLVPAAGVALELDRLTRSLKQSQDDVEKLRVQAETKLGKKLAEIFGAHQWLLQDPQLVDQFRHAIEDERFTAEYAVHTVMNDWAQKFEKLDNPYFQERAHDLIDLERRLVSHLVGVTRTDLKDIRTETIIVARDLTPSQTTALDRSKGKALLTDVGGRTSHTAILAHALGIPAIVGLEDLSSQVATGDQIIVDAHNGLVIVNPDAAQLLEYRQYQAKLAVMESNLDEAARFPAVTLDGESIAVHANIEFPSEIPVALQKGATGIGLYRTEFLYLASDHAPTEEEQYQAYCEAIEYLGDKPLTIRTLDLGADKLAKVVEDETQRSGSEEGNPFLGVRSIRLCLANPPLFKTQLRAILRASVKGNVRIMFPLVSHIMELRQAKMLMGDVMEDLEDEGLPFRRDVPVGIMVEVPSVAIQAKTFAREVAFFSIGTNDLIQYTLAVDRGNERLASLYSGGHPAVLQLIKEVVRAAARAKIDVSICGEMASDPLFVILLVGLGMRSLSVAPPAIPEVKRIIRSVTASQCQRIARRVLSFDSDREVLTYLQDQRNRVLPDLMPGRSAEN